MKTSESGVGRRNFIKAMAATGAAAGSLEVPEGAEKHSGKVSGELTEDVFAGYLATAGIPDPDLIIRTGGEYRISNYLLWQAAYTEFYFSDILWPDFREKEFDDALAEFANRDRRYGKTK